MSEQKAQSIEHLQEEWRNPYLQWYAAGMPAFNTKDISPWKQIAIKFKTMEDRQAFGELVHCFVSEKTNYIWYPEKTREKNITSKVVEDV